MSLILLLPFFILLASRASVYKFNMALLIEYFTLNVPRKRP